MRTGVKPGMMVGMRAGAARFPRAGLLAAMVALILLLSACGAGAGSGSRAQNAVQKIATPMATAAAPVPSLNWRKISTPIDLSHGGVSLGVSPVNGRDAWICGPGKAGQFLIWRTQDAGATWNQISALTPVTPPPTVASSGCNVIADQNLATSVAVWYPATNPSAPGPTSSAVAYYSSDGGMTWRQMGQNWWIDQIATSGATTYALVNDLGNQSNINVFASSDHFATWRSVNPQAQEEAQNPPVLWVSPTSGNALLRNYLNQIYQSTDGGNQWMSTTGQSNPSTQAQLAVWRGQSAGWLLCGASASGSSAQPLCSTDLGKTWAARPAATGASCSAVGLTGDGSLYAVCLGAAGAAEPYVLLRLPLNASAWTTVGGAPDKYITVMQSGQIWLSLGDGSATYVLDQLP